MSTPPRARADSAGQRFWIGAYSAMSLRSLPSDAKRTTTMPPGSRPTTTPSPKAAWMTSSPIRYSALGDSDCALDHDIARGRTFCAAATAPIACRVPSRSVRSGGISLRKRLGRP